MRFYATMLLLPLMLVAACNNKKEENPRQILAGESSKTWVAKRESDSQGDKVKLSERPEEKMVFYANGSFQIQNNAQFQTGRWNYNQGQQELEIVFDDRQDVKEVFHVQELEEDNMVLHASDGSTMRLKPE